MNVLGNYLSRSSVMHRLGNTDYEYIKNFQELSSIDASVNVSLNSFYLSAGAFDLGHYMRRFEQRFSVPLPFWGGLLSNVVIPPPIVQKVDVILSRNLVPHQPTSDIPVVYETNFVTKDRAGVLSNRERRYGIERDLRKVRSFDSYILKTEEEVDRFERAVQSVTGEKLPHQVHYVPYFLPGVESIDSSVLDKKFSEYEPVQLLFVGSYGRQKGLYSFVEALNRLYTERPSLRSKMSITVISKTEIPYCRFDIEEYDYLSHDKVLSKFRESHIFCMPTLRDSYGLVYIEAMASGCAVVADDSSVRHEILDGGNAGLLSNPHDPDDIADKLITLIHSPEYAKQLAMRARDRFQRHYHWKPVGEKYVGLLKRVANGG
jgi:glycosyltransferase involved in cell wall biosynthesis